MIAFKKTSAIILTCLSLGLTCLTPPLSAAELPDVRVPPYLKEFLDWFLQGTPRPSPGCYCFTVWDNPTKILMPSGMLGPVRLVAAQRRRHDVYLPIIYARNEFGEGGVAAPTAGEKDMKRKVVRSIFGR